MLTFTFTIHIIYYSKVKKLMVCAKKFENTKKSKPTSQSILYLHALDLRM